MVDLEDHNLYLGFQACMIVNFQGSTYSSPIIYQFRAYMENCISFVEEQFTPKLDLVCNDTLHDLI